MIREALHQFDQCCSFNQGHATAAFSLLEHDIVRRIFFSETIDRRVRKSENVPNILLSENILKASTAHLSGCFFSSSVRMESRVLSSMDFVFNMTREAIQACFSSELSAFSMTCKQWTVR